jgi:hypothetical protein
MLHLHMTEGRLDEHAGVNAVRRGDDSVSVPSFTTKKELVILQERTGPMLCRCLWMRAR